MLKVCRQVFIIRKKRGTLSIQKYRSLTLSLVLILFALFEQEDEREKKEPEDHSAPEKSSMNTEIRRGSNVRRILVLALAFVLSFILCFGVCY